ncbi:MAG: ComF family protein [Chlorobiota bacterium]
MSGIETLLDAIEPKVCLVSGKVIPPNNPYKYFDEEELLSLQIPPHPLSIRERLIQEYDLDDLAISKVIALFKLNEEDKILDAIHKFKYLGIRGIGEEFGYMLSRLIDKENYDISIPIPIHKARLRERGFNQSEIIAKEIENRIGLLTNNKSIKRNKYTHSQAKLSHNERKSNLAGKFEIIDKSAIFNKRILLIDDVLTTANTANYCAELLLIAGARRVDIAVVAVAY